ncbi:FimV family protein [Pseudomonas sp. OIL-1]|uniref:FimV family protein n=1 Tax=Pseudomonas sp. OIL-1 TaxID=2706126 RepID=UPI0013A7A359|nr:FimV family protein [Pseudomonas sp. OIL-1]QIB52043.1 FimV family protein [Pseudomonas sp. OIL-1]
MVRKLVLAVTAASALMSSNMALALGVGDINLRSALNQPLEAEIELLQVKDLSSEEILPTLASADDFGRAGIDRAFFLTDLNFTPEIKPDGRAVIKVTSSRPVNEPFLNFLMEVRWPSGRVLREFTVLLDPPLYQTSSTPVTAAAPVTPPSAPRQQASAPSRPTQQAAAARPAQQASSAASEGGTLRTSPSDTLWEIALAHRPRGASVHQTMLAIQDLNPQAFLNQNINTMLANQTLTLPDAEQASQRSRADALDQVAQQTSAWQSGRRAAEPSQRQLDARQRETAAAAPAEADTSDSLRLVAGSEDGGGSDSAGGNGEGQLRDALDRTKEQLDSAESEKAELASRLDDVQGQLETLQRLLTLKDTQLAALQEQMGNVAAQEAGAEPGAPESAAVEEESPVDPQLAGTAEPVGSDNESESATAQDEAALAEVSTLDNEAVSAADAPVEPVAVAEAPSVSEPVEATSSARPEVAAAPTESAEPAEVSATQAGGIEGMLQRFLQNQTLMLIAGAAALFILLLILMSISRRNARREQELSNDFLGSSVDSDNDIGTHDGEDFNVALANFDEPEDDQRLNRDVITEADALVAYGKLAEAAETLRSAIDDEPGRTDLRLKLMEVEALQDHPQGYAEQAEAVEHLGGADAQLAEMNARFPAMAAGLVGASMVISDLDENEFDLDLDTAPGGTDDTSDSLFEEDARNFDFGDLDEPAQPKDSLFEDKQDENDAFDLDFDLDDSLAEELAKPEPTDEATASGFDLDLDDELDSETASSACADDFDDADLVLPPRNENDALTELDVIDPLEADAAATGTGETAETEQTTGDFGFSDADLADFESELNASIEAETEAAESEADAEKLSSLPDALDPFTGNMPTDQAMSESMEDEFDFLSGTDECATKLDLARAYVDMGDEEGARDILAEVIEEGNDQQQQDAREMMEQLA